MKTLEYHTRNHAFVTSMVLRIDGDVLVVEQEGRKEQIPLKDIQVIELSYFPTRAELNRYRCRLYRKHKKVLEFYNRTYKGLMDFEDTSKEYKAFVLSLHEALHKYNQHCQYRSGVSPRLFWFNTGCLFFVLFVLVFAFFYLTSDGMHWSIFIKALILLIYLPFAIQWVRRNVPKRYTPNQIPAEVLPP
ncbi:MAG: hypothetical protein N2442_14570 [Spirochaetes bacterium]|nr:hypothetical protein [Spirochaetota bacterium]